MSMEYKVFPCEVKVDIEQPGFVEGYGSVFGNIDLGGDVVEPGAFAKSLRKSKGRVKMFSEHRHAIGMFNAVEDTKGLKVSGHALIEEVQVARETHALAKAGVFDGMSIGYVTKKATEGEGNTRKLVEVELFEVSLLPFPMNPKARPTRVKALDPERIKSIITVRELEEALRDAGFSNQQAKAVASAGFKGLNLRDEDSEASTQLGSLIAGLTAQLNGGS